MAGENANTPGMSLQELDNLPDPNKKPDIKAGDGAETAADLEAARQKAEADRIAKAEKEGQGAGGGETTEQRITALEAVPEADRTPEQVAELEKLKPAGTDAETDDDDTLFIADIDKIRGEQLKVVYKDEQGQDVGPLTPMGIYLRERAAQELAVQRFETNLRKNDPRGYQYLLHRENGGDDESFFAAKSPTLPDYDAFKESVDLQVKVYTESLISKGVDAETAKVITDQAVKDKKIFGKAEIAYKEVKANEELAVKNLQDKLLKDQQAYTKSIENLDKMFDSTISKGQDMKLVIPDAKKVEFATFVRSIVEHDPTTGSFMFVQPISKEELPRMLEALYFQFVKGDLSGLVQRQAQTQNARRIQTNMKKATDKPGGGEPAQRKIKPSLSDIT